MMKPKPLLPRVGLLVVVKEPATFRASVRTETAAETFVNPKASEAVQPQSQLLAGLKAPR